VRGLAPDVDDAVFVVGESGTTYELNLSVSDNPDQTVVISAITKSLWFQAKQAKQVPALDLMRSMMRGLPVDGYEIIKANRKEVYRDASLHEASRCVPFYRQTHFQRSQARTPEAKNRRKISTISRSARGKTGWIRTL